jgi:hypothetical protein
MSRVVSPVTLAPVPALVTVLGIDIGDTTGMLLGTWDRETRKALEARAFQCDREASPLLLGWILAEYGFAICGGGIEAFVSGPRSLKLKGTKAEPIRAQHADLTAIAAAAGVRLVSRPAVTVKAWSTDDRLRAAGLLDITAGQGHARDGGRHAIYAACHDRGLPDPLSRRHRTLSSQGTRTGATTEDSEMTT